MSHTRRILAGLSVWFLAGHPPDVSAQQAVPGGWAAQVGFKSFSSPDPPVGPPAGYGSLMGVAPNPFGGVGAYPLGPQVPGPAFSPQPQVVNGLLPLTEAVRGQSRKRPRR